MHGVVVCPRFWSVHASELPPLLLQIMDQFILLYHTEILAPGGLFKAAVRLALERV